MDSKHVSIGGGRLVYHFAALDCYTRKRVVGLTRSLSSQQGAEFLRRAVSEFPFEVAAVQSDGGSEFLGAFRLAAEELQLPHYFNRPNYPQGNSQVERSFRTDEDEFYQVEDLPADLGGIEAALLTWNRVYEQVQPHQALGYQTPEQFYQDWLTKHTVGKGVLSDMY